MLYISASNTEPLVKQLQAVGRGLQKELGIAAWRTVKKGKSIAAKQIGQDLNASQATIKRVIKGKKLSDTTSILVVKRARIRQGMSLRRLARKPRTTKRGVTAVVRKSGGVITWPYAWESKATGHILTRPGKKTRAPIRIVRTPETVELFDGALASITAREMREFFIKQIEEQIRYNINRINGTLRNQKPKPVTSQG